jgi:PHYB activation tagged suppressor 1
MIEAWCTQIHQNRSGHRAAEIDMASAFSQLTEEVIGRFAFGTSHRKSREAILAAMDEMQKITAVAISDPPILWLQSLLALICYGFTRKALPH